MIPSDAAKLLEIPADATPEQIEARFVELRRKLEDKIAKAPTPGLQAKYRATLAEVTEAFEALTLAADSSSLPVLKRHEPAAAPSRSSTPSPANAVHAPKAKSSGKEFILIAIAAVVVLGAGGTWLMHRRAANAETARLARESKLEAERQAAAAKQQAEEKTRRDEAERARAAAAEKAERERQEKNLTQLRARVAELNVNFDAALRAQQTAERELSDLKSRERDLARDAKGGASPDSRAAAAETRAQERWVAWMNDTLPTHPAKLARVRAEEMLSARAGDEAAAATEAYAAALKQLQSDLAASRREMLTLTGTLEITAEPAGVTYSLQDAYGRTTQGELPAQRSNVPLGRATVTFLRPGWPAHSTTISVARDAPATVSADLTGGGLEIASNPTGLAFVLQGQGRTDKGVTPVKFAELPVGDYSLVIQRSDWPGQTRTVTVRKKDPARLQVDFPAAGQTKLTSVPAGAEVWLQGKLLGVTPLELADRAPGNYDFEFRLKEYLTAKKSGVLDAGGQLELTVALEKRIYTQQEIFEEFWRQAAGVWRAGNSPNFLRITAGSTTIIRRLKMLGMSDSKITMAGFDPETKMIVVTQMMNPTRYMKVRGDELLYGSKDVKDGWRRISDSEW